MDKIKLEIPLIVSVMKRQGYEVKTRPNELNIVGVRKNSTESNSFNDIIYIFFKDQSNNWQGFKTASTTDPGTFWLKNPMMPKGTAILKAGQYDYKLGSHRGYTAFNQASPVTVIRDYNRDSILDWNNGREESGFFGINIHRAGAESPSQLVDKWSAGCQVIADPVDFAKLIELGKIHSAAYGNSFKYTLIDERSLERKKKTTPCLWRYRTCNCGRCFIFFN
jgi:hypothetical protein